MAVPSTSQADLSTRSGSTGLRLAVTASDVAALAVGHAILLAVLAMVPATTPGADPWTGLAAVVGVGSLALHAAGAYERRVVRVRRREVAVTSKAAAAPAGLLALLSPQTSLLVAMAVATLAWFVWASLLGGSRALIGEWIRGSRARGRLAAPVLVIGTGRAQEMARFLEKHPHLGFAVADTVELLPETVEDSFRMVADVARTTRATGVVVSDPGDPVIQPLLPALSRAGLHVHVATGVQGLERATAVTSSMAGELFLDFAPRRLDPWQQAAIRVADLTIATIGLLVTLPISLVVAAAVRLTDGGPVLYVQERIGRHEVPFPMFKFRSMRVDADQIELEDEDANGRDGPLVKRAKDPRVTSVGRLIRATSLDELPQLLNVLRGEMSIVGPRPALASEVAEFDAVLRRRTEVRPGLTGLWQVEGRDLPSFELYRRLDLLWVDNQSLGLYVTTLLRTVSALLGQSTRSLLGDAEATLAPEPRRQLIEVPEAPHTAAEVADTIPEPLPDTVDRKTD